MIKNLFGSEKRKDIIVSQDTRLIEEIDKSLNQLFSNEHLLKAYSDEEFQAVLETTLLKLLENKKTNDSDLILDHVALKVKEINDRYALNLPILITPPSQYESTFKIKDWYIKRSQLNTIFNLYIDKLNSQPLPKLSREDLVGHILISAAIYGGLCIPEVLTSLANNLWNREYELKTDGERFWFDLILEKSKLNFNFVKRDKELTLRRWYLDPVTKLWIYNLINFEKSSYPATKQNFTDNRCSRLIVNLLCSYTSHSLNIGSLSLFCRSAIGITENLPSVDLNQVMVNYATGTSKSSSLPAQFLDSSYISNLIEASKPSKSNRTSRFPLNKHQETKLISSIISVETINGKAVTSKQLSKKLRALMEQHNLSESTFILLDFLDSLLTLTRRASSIRRYFSSIGAGWIEYTHDKDLTALDPNEFETIYPNIIASKDKNKAQQYAKNLVVRVHQYGIMEFDFPELIKGSTFRHTNTGFDNNEFIRASFISESLFSKLASEIFSPFNSIENRNDVFAFALLTYRFGIRGCELIKLMVKEIEPSASLWVTMKNNPFGFNKSDSGLRKLPVALILTREEETFLTELYNNKKLKCNNSDKALLFSSAINENIPLNYRLISRTIKTLLQNITDLPVSYNSLRHTALSRLQLIFDGSPSLIAQYTPYSSGQIKNLKQVMGDWKKDNYWIVSGSAGHLTPEVTLKHYLHFSDLLLATKLEEMEVCFSKQGLINISNLTTNKITRSTKHICKKEQEYPVHALDSFISEKLRYYCRRTNHYTALFSTTVKPYNLKFQDKITLEKCYKILTKLDNGIAIQQASSISSISEDSIKKWLDNASSLAQLKTSKNKSRLFPASENNPINENRISPIMPTSIAEQHDATNIISEFRGQFESNKGKRSFRPHIPVLA